MLPIGMIYYKLFFKMFVPHRPYWIVSTGGEINSEDLEKLVKKKKKGSEKIYLPNTELKV